MEDDKIPDKLYHYCSVDTFKIIAEKKTLRLSEIAKSNDSMECQWMEKVIVPSMIEEYVRGLIKRKKLGANESIHDLDKSISLYTANAIKEVDYFFNGEDGTIHNRVVFATCFSKWSDQLSQWRGYACDGAGLSLGFDTKMFQPFINDDPLLPYNLKKVVYNRRVQERFVREKIRNYTESFASDANEKKIFAAIELVQRTVVSSVYMKNPAFNEEAEWRFYLAIDRGKKFSAFRDAFMYYILDDKFTPVSVTIRDDKAIFFTDMQLDKQKDATKPLSWIKEIVLGPKCKLSERDIKLILECYDWDTSSINIIRSKATYV
ncbi:MAG: DUF2971 domain-containing protein [Petrimonas sp.]|nr:DUF2971 domain-containing protein [Christensenella sp.]MEA4951037.1 DUF2971 domain-containing protein [Petrimonas sp.]